MIKPTKARVLWYHQALIDDYGGSHGIRDEGLLESAISMPFMTFDGIALYPSLEEKAARLCYGLVKNHPFVDGNKRIGAVCMEAFLYSNGIKLQYSHKEELSDCILAVVENKMDIDDLVLWIQSHTKAE